MEAFCSRVAEYAAGKSGGWCGAISTKTLTDWLRMLEAERWISRHDEPTVPPQVTYAITDKVLELDGVMIELDRIAERQVR